MLIAIVYDSGYGHAARQIGDKLGAVAQTDGDAGPDIAPIESDLKTAAHLGTAYLS